MPFISRGNELWLGGTALGCRRAKTGEVCFQSPGESPVVASPWRLFPHSLRLDSLAQTRQFGPFYRLTNQVRVCTGTPAAEALRAI